MTCSDLVGIKLERKIKKSLELDLTIAKNVRIRRPSGLILSKDNGKYSVPVFS